MPKKIIYADDAIDGKITAVISGQAIEAIPVSYIKQLPSAQPQRIKGKWKRTKANSGYNAEWVCSNCGYTVYAEFCNYHYCSSCGSDMRGDEDET